MVEKGGHVVMIDVNTEEGGLSLNEDFFVDFGAEPNGPALPHGLSKMKISGFEKYSSVNYALLYLLQKCAILAVIVLQMSGFH